MSDKPKVVITVLVLIIVILGGILVYALVVRPTITNYAINAQNQGYVFAITQIMQLAAQCQTVPLTSGNVTINLVSVECLQQQQPQ